MITIFHFAILTISSSILVERKNVEDISVSSGSIFTQTVPTVFSNFQFTQLLQFTRISNREPSYLCHIKVQKEGQLVRKSSLTYSDKDVSNMTEQIMEDRIVFRFQELLSLRTLTDSLRINNKIYTLFSMGTVSVYVIDLEGQLIREMTYQIKIQKTEETFLVNIMDSIIIISKSRAVRINGDGSQTNLTGYNGTVNAINHLKSIRSVLYLGLGEQGIATFDYDSKENSLLQIKTSTFHFQGPSQQVLFAVDQFDIDPVQNILYVLDYTEGLLQVSLSHLKRSIKVYSQSARLLVSGCTNIVVLSLNLYVTCPELIAIDRSNWMIIKIVHNSFYPSKVQFQKQRLYLYGSRELAIYDIFGKVIDEYKLSSHAQQSMMVGEFLVTIGSFQISAQMIIPQLQAFQCYFNDESQEGQYKGIIQTEGICSQYTTTSIPKNKTNDICTVELPITVTFEDTSKLDLTIELYILGIWVAGNIVIAISLTIHHYCKIKMYQPLTQEEFKELDQLSETKTTVLKERKSKSEIVVTE